MTEPWVCIDCGARQDAQGRCRACGHEDTLDARDERVRELMRDVDLRLAGRREGRLRVLGVAVGMVTVVALWMVPGYWDLRSKLFALPILIDQWALMGVIGYAVSKGLEKYVMRPRFPYLRHDLTIG